MDREVLFQITRFIRSTPLASSSDLRFSVSHRKPPPLEFDGMAKDDAMITDEKPAAVPVILETKQITVQSSLKGIVSLLESTVKTKDTRLLAGRLHRQTAAIRSQLTNEILSEFISTYLSGPEATASKVFLMEQVRSLWP